MAQITATVRQAQARRAFLRAVEVYRQATGRDPSLIVCHPATVHLLAGNTLGIPITVDGNVKADHISPQEQER